MEGTEWAPRLVHSILIRDSVLTTFFTVLYDLLEVFMICV